VQNSSSEDTKWECPRDFLMKDITQGSEKKGAV
jgi:hypothetical protein